MSEYAIRPEKRQALEDSVEEWLQLEGVRHIEVARKRGRGRSKVVDSEIDADELAALGTGPAVVDRVLETVDRFGGRMELVCRFDDYDKPGGKTDLTKTFQLVRVREPSTKSQGNHAATEQLASSLASAFDQQAARAESRDERYTEFLSSMMLRQDEGAERRLTEHSSYQIEIMRLRDDLARKDLEIALIEANTGMPPELWAEVLKVGVPVVGQLVGALTIAISTWGASYRTGALPEPEAAPQPAPVSETPPAEPQQQPAPQA